MNFENFCLLLLCLHLKGQQMKILRISQQGDSLLHVLCKKMVELVIVKRW